jgi:hypothetical protein
MKQHRIAMIMTLGLGLGSGLWAQTSTPSDAAKEPLPRGLVVPSSKVFNSQREVYNSTPGEQLLMILHVPKESGPVFIEVFNRTKEEMSLFQFTLSSLGHEGELVFDDLPPGWSAVKEVRLGSLRELAIRNAKAYNKNADEIQPRLVLHQIEQGNRPLKTGKHKI